MGGGGSSGRWSGEMIEEGWEDFDSHTFGN